MNTVPPSTMRMSEAVNYYGAHSVPVDSLIVALESLEKIEDDVPEIAYLEDEIQVLTKKVESLEEDIEALQAEIESLTKETS